MYVVPSERNPTSYSKAAWTRTPKLRRQVWTKAPQAFWYQARVRASSSSRTFSSCSQTPSSCSKTIGNPEDTSPQSSSHTRKTSISKLNRLQKPEALDWQKADYYSYYHETQTPKGMQQLDPLQGYGELYRDSIGAITALYRGSNF